MTLYANEPITVTQEWLENHEDQFSDEAMEEWGWMWNGDLEFLIKQHVKGTYIECTFPSAAACLRCLTDADHEYISYHHYPETEQYLLEYGADRFKENWVWEKEIVTEEDREAHNQSVRDIVFDLAGSMLEQMVEYAVEKYNPEEYQTIVDRRAAVKAEREQQKNA